MTNAAKTANLLLAVSLLFETLFLLSIGISFSWQHSQDAGIDPSFYI